MLKGIDALGIKSNNFPVDLLIKHSIEKQFDGYLIDDTFGTNNKNLIKAIERPTCIGARLHLLDGTAVRNQKLYTTSPLRGYKIATLDRAIITGDVKFYKILDKYIKLASDIVNKFNTQQFLISGIMEHDLSLEGADRLLGYLAKHFDKSVLVDNPVENSGYIKGILTEGHGNRKFKGTRDVRSGDGASNFNASFYEKDYAYHASAKKLLLYWWDELNIRRSGADSKRHKEDEFVQPTLRGNKGTPSEHFIPSEYQFKLAKELLLREPEAIPEVRGARQLQGEEICKIHSDTVIGGGNSRSQKLCLIVKSSAKVLNITKLGGTKIGETRGSGGFDYGMTRFYLGKIGLNNLTLLKKNDNKEWCIFTDGKNKWLVNLLRRTGKLRNE